MSEEFPCISIYKVKQNISPEVAQGIFQRKTLKYNLGR